MHSVIYAMQKLAMQGIDSPGPIEGHGFWETPQILLMSLCSYDCFTDTWVGSIKTQT